MGTDSTEALFRYIDRIRPIYHQLFNITHAICGNSRRAEYALQCAILAYWRESDGSRRGSLRDGLRNTLTRTAMRAATDRRAPAGEDTWDGLTAQTGTALGRLIAAEPSALRRMLALKYGCNLSPNRIGRLMRVEPKRIQSELSGFESRAQRQLGGRRIDGELRRIVRGDMSSPSAAAPDFGAMMRAFQADADSDSPRGRLASRILHIVLTAILTLICIAVFWLLAVLRAPV